jgi:hypothetical protein
MVALFDLSLTLQVIIGFQLADMKQGALVVLEVLVE